jgi:hypothetical protein
MCQKPQVKDLWHVNATLRVVFEHAQNSICSLYHMFKTYGILTFKWNMRKKKAELRKNIRSEKS